MPTNSFFKKYRVHPDASEDLMKNLLRDPELSIEKQKEIQKRIGENKRRSQEALLKFQSIIKK